ncbi:MAG: glutamate 5-kinase [Tissierellia bacterium]|nr:glutamate 5-kinase [Tissierellia bacterium]
MSRFSKPLKRIVIKVGSSSITHKNGEVDLQTIDQLAWEMANIKNHGIDIALVSSGAIFAGAKRMNLKGRPKDTIGKQAASAVGQVALMNTYHRAFHQYNYQAAQILLTRQVEHDKVMQENARNSLDKLFSMNTIPVINENDAISTLEIEFGDNDTLSSVVAVTVDADLLILLSDIDGLYTADPRTDKRATLIPEVTKITPELEAMAEDTESSSGVGGMVTKIGAALRCMNHGIDMVIANGEDMKIIRKIVAGENIGTIFKGGTND